MRTIPMALTGCLALLLAAPGFAAPARARPRPAVKAPASKRVPAPAPTPPAEAALPTPPASNEALAPTAAPVPASAPAPAVKEAPVAPAAADKSLDKDKAADVQAAGGAANLDKLRADYAELRDQLFRSRARRETLESALLSTQVLTTLRFDASRRYLCKHAEVRLDGVRLWEASEGGVGDKPVTLAPKSAPPGPHVLSVRVEIRPRDNPKLGYVSEQSFSLNLNEGKKTKVEITIDEDGSLPSYNPDIEIEIDEDK